MSYGNFFLMLRYFVMEYNFHYVQTLDAERFSPYLCLLLSFNIPSWNTIFIMSGYFHYVDNIPVFGSSYVKSRSCYCYVNFAIYYDECMVSLKC